MKGFNLNARFGGTALFGGVSEYADGSLSGFVRVNGVQYAKVKDLHFSGYDVVAEFARSETDPETILLSLSPEFKSASVQLVSDLEQRAGMVEITSGYFSVYYTANGIRVVVKV